MWRALVIGLALASPLAAQDFFTLKGHGGPIMDIAVAPDGKVATASFDNSVGVWEGRAPFWFDGHEAAVNALALGPFDSMVSGADDFTVRFWHAHTKVRPAARAVSVLGKHTAKVSDVAIHPQGGEAATASWDATIGIWSLQKREPGHYFLKAPSPVNAVAYSTDESHLYAATKSGELLAYTLETNMPPRTLVKHGFGINKIIVTDDWIAYGAVDGGTRVIVPETGAVIADFTLDRRPILSMAYHAPSNSLAAGDGQGYIMVIDTAKMRITRDFRAAQRGPIWALAFSPDGQNIYAGGIEDIVYSWPVATLDEHEPMAGTTRSFLEDPATLPNGERQFKRKCSICHTLAKGSARKAGPSLYGLYGRRAGTVPDYTYSQTLNDSEIVWSPATINALFDEGPDHYIPGTKMPMQRIVEQKDRDDLIDYLRRATAQQEN